ncbi:unnamed protein product, partial [Ascophyllum nodosum]
AEQSLVDSTGSAGIQGGSDGRREPKSNRKKGSDGADVRKNLNTHSANEGDAAARHGIAGNSGGNDSGGGHSGESARKGRRHRGGDEPHTFREEDEPFLFLR